jgi:hypothetical protein
MKSLLIAAALTGVSLTSSAFAFEPKAAAPTPHIVPSSVVKPVDLPRQFSGALINVEFKLDAAGQPRDIKVLTIQDRALTKQLVAAFSQWRFAGVDQQIDTQKKFILPVHLLPEV